jgi:tetratricopeptide (TPR) repeat protein
VTRRQHSRFAQSLLVIAALAIAGASPTAVWAAGAVSIPELMAAKKKGEWPAYAQSGASMKIEGRQAVFSSTLLRFLKCEDLNFVWYKEDEPFPVDPADLHGRNLEVFGHFEMRSSKPTFVVRQLRTLPSDEEALRDKKGALADAPAEEWYALGNWVLARGTFYSDRALTRESRACYAEGVRREQKLLPDDSLEGRLALAKKYSQYGLPEEDRLAFVQESLARRWLALRGPRASSKDLEGLSQQIDENLQGCKVPLTSQDEPLRKRAALDPVGTYRTASAPERLRVNRALWTEVRSAFWDAWAKERNRDPMQLADRIDREIPERHARAESLRSGALDQKLADVVHLSRDDLLELADQFQHRGQPEKALQAKRAWVKVKEERLTKAGRPSDLMQAAREYQSLLDDNESAARLLIEASKTAPDLKDISSQLERRGYKKVNGKWLTAAEVAALPADPFQKQAEAGHYTGMTREQIRKLNGMPDSRTRVVAAGRLSEVWIYEQNAKSRLSIHFVGSADGHDVTAVRVGQ